MLPVTGRERVHRARTRVAIRLLPRHREGEFLRMTVEKRCLMIEGRRVTRRRHRCRSSARLKADRGRGAGLRARRRFRNRKRTKSGKRKMIGTRIIWMTARRVLRLKRRRKRKCRLTSTLKKRRITLGSLRMHMDTRLIRTKRKSVRDARPPATHPPNASSRHHEQSVAARKAAHLPATPTVRKRSTGRTSLTAQSRNRRS